MKETKGMGIRAAVVVLIMVLLTIAPAGAAFAKASGAAASPASCMGHEASGISPPGSLEEFPGGMPAFKAFVDENFAGVPTGRIISQFARLHAGSHEACDAAVE